MSSFLKTLSRTDAQKYQKYYTERFNFLSRNNVSHHDGDVIEAESKTWAAAQINQDNQNDVHQKLANPQRPKNYWTKWSKTGDELNFDVRAARHEKEYKSPVERMLEREDRWQS